ncbi:cell wall synthase accessory phosphoprotein MacP [Streptococcus fryi]
MGKPLLTDEIIERANKGESLETAYPYSDFTVDDEDTKIIDLQSDRLIAHDLEVDNRIIQSRHIENAKRHAFQSKLNLILLGLVLLLALVLYAVFNW